MLKNKLTCYICFVLVALVSPNILLAAEELPEVIGVFGLTGDSPTAAAAFWVPVSEGQSVSGLHWFNNDGQVAFPEVVAAAGSIDGPTDLGESIIVGTHYSGVELGWNELVFPQPLSAVSGGFWIVFFFPENSTFIHAGNEGGSGFGYVSGQDHNSCWITADGIEWNALTASHQMAMVPVENFEKSGNVLVLGSGSGIVDRIENSTQEKPKIPLMRAVPNPFNPDTTVKFSTQGFGLVKVVVYDLRGHKVRSLLERELEAGDHEVRWNGRDEKGRVANSGVYLVQIRGSKLNETIRVTLTK